ncbi:MAG: hypothetical protein L6Q63_17505 [Giesbergeria sp.]|nr:hypothetical protein [Giesbergeria sp.]
MPTLEKRLEALEANTPHIPDRVTLVTFVKPGELDKEIQRICTALVADEGQQWIRESGETEQEFRERATREAPRNAYGASLLFGSSD